MGVVSDIIHSKTKIDLFCKGKESFIDCINYGFAYIEHRDYIVAYVMANHVNMKKIFGIHDSILGLEKEYIGKLWTAKLLLYEKLRDFQVIFSDDSYLVVVNLNMNVSFEEVNNAYI